jgi:hypothetical protein
VCVYCCRAYDKAVCGVGVECEIFDEEGGDEAGAQSVDAEGHGA